MAKTKPSEITGDFEIYWGFIGDGVGHFYVIHAPTGKLMHFKSGEVDTSDEDDLRARFGI